MLRTEWTTVGELRALVHVPDEPVAALVLVDVLPMVGSFLRSVG